MPQIHFLSVGMKELEVTEPEKCHLGGAAQPESDSQQKQETQKILTLITNFIYQYNSQFIRGAVHHKNSQNSD